MKARVFRTSTGQWGATMPVGWIRNIHPDSALEMQIGLGIFATWREAFDIAMRAGRR